MRTDFVALLSRFAMISIVTCPFAAPSLMMAQVAYHAADDDLALARRMVTLISDQQTGKCVSCHSATYEKILHWGKQWQSLQRKCLNQDVSLSARERVNCLRDNTGNENSGFSATTLGLLSAGTKSEAMRSLFAAAYPQATEYEKHYGNLVHDGSMPSNQSPAPALTDEEFSALQHWVVDRSMARLQDVLPAGPTTNCTTTISDDLRNTVAQMQQNGWRRRHLENGLSMLGCARGQAAKDCLQSFPNITDATGHPAVAQSIRRLFQTTSSSRYWVRSAPNGRYIGFGNTQVGWIVDLGPHADGKPYKIISARAKYDPEFLADNSGFSFADTAAGGIGLCKTSLLARLINGDNATVTFSEPECRAVGRGTYQSFGSSLSGNSYVLTMGEYTSDVGNGPTGIDTKPDSHATFNVLRYDGLDYQLKATTRIIMPYESEVVISPSSQMFVTRYGQNNSMTSYRLHGLTISGSEVKARPLGEICGIGGKATFSLDERFIAYHRYQSPRDPSTSDMARGSANIFVVDLLTGITTQVTDMPANNRALFPHFRADGWLYFLVKDGENGGEYVAASNAVLGLE